MSVPDSGFRTGNRVTWDIGVAVPYIYLGTGGHDQIRAVVTARAKPGKSRLVPGGRRRTAFSLFKGVVEDVEIGCRSSRGVLPIAQDATCCGVSRAAAACPGS